MTDLDRIGGLDALRGHVQAFVDRFFDDMIIGFTFAGKDRARVVTHEVEHAARTLGGDVPYTGRPIAPLHRALRINAGQFRRRLAIVRTVLRERGVEEAIIDRWIEADRRMERVITDGTDCVGEPG